MTFPVRRLSSAATLLLSACLGFADSRPSESRDWRPAAAFGGPATRFSAAFTIGDRAYVGTGYGGRNEVWRYDPAADAWARMADLPGEARGAAIAFSIGGRGYIGLGYREDERFADLWQYDPAADRWLPKAPLPAAPRDHCGVFAIGGKAYVWGGMTCKGPDCGELTEAWEYDPASDRWARKADLPETILWAGYFVLDGKGYVVGGPRQGLTGAPHVWEYDPRTDAWTRKADFPGPRRFRAVGYALDGKGHLATGIAAMARTSAQVLNDVWEYDPATDAWTQKPDFEGTPRGAAVAFVLGREAYIGTGMNAALEPLRDFVRASPDAGGAAPAAGDILDAVRNRDLARVKELLRRDPGLIGAKDAYQNSLFRVALLQNDLATARLLVESGIDVKYGRADIGGNELFGAVQSGSLELTRLVFERGADIHSADRWGNTPLDLAVMDGSKEIADFLMDHGAALNVAGKGVPTLLRAALRGGLDRVTEKLLREPGIDYRGVSGTGDTYLHAVAQGGDPARVGFLVEQGVHPDARNVYGWTALHFAASRGHRAMVDALLERGADRNSRANDGKTPYNVAAELGGQELLRHLEEKGFDTAPPRFPRLEARYIDPDLPRKTPRRFAPGIVSTLPHFEHGLFSFDEAMTTACWVDWQSEGVSRIFVMERRDGAWQAPQTVQLRGTNPRLSPDGNTIVFTAPRTPADGREARDNDIFLIRRTAGGWSERVDAGPGVNTDRDEIEPVITRDGDLYFSCEADLYRARLVNGRYAPRERLPPPVNSDRNECHPWVSADGRMLFFRSMGRGGFREPNWFCSFLGEDGSWSQPVDLEKRLPRVGLFPSPTPDLKYLTYFEGGDLFWVDAADALAGLIK